MENRRLKMLPSKPRIFASCGSGSPEVLNKTVSASKRNLYSLKSVEQKSSKVAKVPAIVKVSEMQQHMGDLQEEFQKMREQLDVAERERDRALDELRGMKKAADEANVRLSEALSSRKAGEIFTELNSVKKALSDSSEELKIRENNIASLKLELEKAKQFELKLAEKDVLLDKCKKELSNAKSSEFRAVDLLSQSKIRIQELEAEEEKGKELETSMLNSFATQTKLLEESKIALEESKLEIASLQEKVERLEGLSRQGSGNPDSSHSDNSIKEALENLSSELQLTKEKLVHAQEGEKLSSLKADGILEEMGLLKNELKAAVEAEEKSKRAMDDLALALTEVAAEASQVKEKLSTTEAELEDSKGETEQLKLTVRSMDNKYQGILNESKKENDCLKNTVERLRVEAEESLLAWNEKEIGFVSCIKRAEDERTAAQQENNRVIESLRGAENNTRASREENHKLRDILKQALNEASVAKEAAGIARAENSQLKDCLAAKDDFLDALTRDNESLRINESAARENIKELKHLLSAASTKELKTENKELGKKFRASNSMLKEHKEDEEIDKTFSFDLNELNFTNKNEGIDEDPKKADALKGSIFDLVESLEPGYHHRKGSSSTFTDDGETINSEDFDDTDSDRSSQRKKKALLRKFGSLIRKGSFHRKEVSME